MGDAGSRPIWPDSPLVQPSTSRRDPRIHRHLRRRVLPRELDEPLGLSPLIERHLTDPRTRFQCEASNGGWIPGVIIRGSGGR